jgi:putative membrane protein
MRIGGATRGKVAGKIASVIGAYLIAFANPARAVNDEADFLRRASIGHLTAILEGRLAVERAADPRVRALAQRFVDEDKSAGADLETASQGSGAAAVLALDPIHQIHVTALQEKYGTEFDEAYIADQIEVHCNALSLHADYMLLGGNAKLVALARKMVPISEQQCVDAKALSGR